MPYSNNPRNTPDARKYRNADGSFPAYAWPGGYPLYYLAIEEIMPSLAVVCPDCASLEDSEVFLSMDINWEDDSLYCDNCGDRIQSAYAEPTGEA